MIKYIFYFPGGMQYYGQHVVAPHHQHHQHNHHHRCGAVVIAGSGVGTGMGGTSPSSMAMQQNMHKKNSIRGGGEVLKRTRGQTA